MDSIFGFYFYNDCSSFFEDNIVNIIGIIVALITFILERLISSKREKESAKINWYLNIIVNPQLEKLGNFYSETEKDLETSINLLKSSANSSNKLVLISSQGRLFKNKKDKFWNDFISLISSYNTDLAIDVQNVINELNDFYMSALDNYNDFNKSDLLNIYTNKEKLYRKLFQALNSK